MNINYSTAFWLTAPRHFAHIVNLACKEMLKEVVNSGNDQIPHLKQVIAFVSPFFENMIYRLIFLKDLRLIIKAGSSHQHCKGLGSIEDSTATHS